MKGDVFGQVYEYFLGKFAMSEGQKGGEFFTPTSIVKLIVEVLEPYSGKILAPACGSNSVLFIDARNIYRQIDRAHRDYTDQQLDFIANIVRRYRGEELDSVPAESVRTFHATSQQDGDLAKAAEEGIEYNVRTYHSTSQQTSRPDNMDELFPNGQYRDIPGLCKVATVEEIEEQGWSLNRAALWA